MNRHLRELPGYLFLSVFSLFSLFPLFFMFISATNTSRDVLSTKLTPGSAFVDNLSKLLVQTNLLGALWNSALVAGVTTVLALLLCSIAGYGFEIFHSEGKDRFMALLLLGMMIPFAATMIPLFRMFAEIGILNSLWAVIVPTIATPFLILLFRQASRSFPIEIIEAARLDGLSELQIFLRIYIPSMKATYAAAAVITFMSAWNNFLWPKVVLLDPERHTMPILISNLSAGYVIDYGVLMLAVAISSLPAMALFFVLQRSFAAGITGAIK